MDANEKIKLFHSFFRGREDVYAVRWERHSGSSGYRPVFEEFSPEVVKLHLTGRLVVGVYPLLLDNTTWFLALDFDGENAARDALKVFREIRQRELPALLERSRSGRGFHVWLFFDKPIAAARARKLGRHLLDSASIGGKSFDRFFPSQDFHTGEKGLGNLIALPLQWASRQMGNATFVNSENLEAFPCPWAVLSSTGRVGEEDLEVVLSEASQSLYAPLPLLSHETTSPTLTDESADPVLVTLKEHLEVALPCPAPLAELLKKWSSFPNPDWFSKQRGGRYLGDTPRFIRVGGRAGDAWVLPRGVWARLRAVLSEVEHKITDQRTAPDPLQWTSDFKLKPHQIEMVHLLLPHEEAVLEAPTGAGKTMVAMEMMVRRGLPTLVIVHSRPLLDQWVERIVTAFSIDKRKLGLIRRGKVTMGEQVTIATFQSLVKKDLNELADWCGHLVVDECHHVPARTFASVLRRLKPKYLLGLTATAKRKDGLSRLIFDYLGTRVKATTPRQLEKKSVIVLPELVVHRTDFRHEGNDNHFQELRSLVLRDPLRNEQITNDVKAAVEQGHLVLLLSDRKEHCDLLSNALAGHVGCATMYGRVGKKKRKLLFTEFESGEIQVLIATAALVGEGWDCPPLSALFLALPVGAGRVAQLIGRLTRPDPEKPIPVIHDYLDEEITALKTMFHRRLRAFRGILGDKRLPSEFRLESPSNRADITYGPNLGKGERKRRSVARESEGQLYLFDQG